MSDILEKIMSEQDDVDFEFGVFLVKLSTFLYQRMKKL